MFSILQDIIVVYVEPDFFKAYAVSYFKKKRYKKEIPLEAVWVFSMHGSLEYCLNNEIFLKGEQNYLNGYKTKDCNICQTKYNIIFKITQSRNVILILLVGKLKIRSVTGQARTNITLERVLKSRNPFYQSSFHSTVQPFLP